MKNIIEHIFINNIYINNYFPLTILFIILNVCKNIINYAIY